MKDPIKEDKCKKEFEQWYHCDTNTYSYIKEFKKPNPIYLPEKDPLALLM